LHRIRYSCRILIIEAWIYSAEFRKLPKHEISLKSIQWEPTSMRTDRRA